MVKRALSLPDSTLELSLLLFRQPIIHGKNTIHSGMMQPAFDVPPDPMVSFNSFGREVCRNDFCLFEPGGTFLRRHRVVVVFRYVNKFADPLTFFSL